MPRPLERSSLAWIRTALLVVLLALLGTRLSGPTDLWDQTQPRTIAYTTDMLVHGGAALLLPRDSADLPATKPPLYNWLAVPAVAALGRESEVGHKLPSLVALLATLLITVAIGERLIVGCGWCAAIMLATCYPMIKLGYLARPDMVLVLVLLIGWWAGTRLLLGAPLERASGLPPTDSSDGGSSARENPNHGRTVRWQLIFWSAFVAAAWIKGPPAVLLPAYGLLAAPLLAGRRSAWTAIRGLGLPWAVPAVVLATAWPLAVWALDADHLRRRLIDQELLGRITGQGPEGGFRGPLGILTTGLHMPGYLVLRFLPWSIPAVLGGVAIVRGWRRGDPMRSVTHRVLEAAVLWVGLGLVLFSLSSGKRADYAAPLLPMVALLAGWWLCDAARILARPLAVVVIAYAAAAAMWFGIGRAMPAPLEVQESIAEIERLTRGEREVVDVLEPSALLLILRTPAEHLPALVGSGRPRDSSAEGVLEALEAGRAVRLVHEPMHLPEPIRRLVLEAEIDGRLRTLWRVPVPWEHLPGLAVECVEIRGAEESRRRILAEDPA